MGTNATKKAASKIIAVLLAALMLVSVMPMTAFAAKDSTIEVEGLTVYGWEKSDLDYIDLDDDSKEAKTVDAFSFEGLTIEVTYRSLVDIKNNGEKAERLTETIDGYNAKLWTKYGIECYADGKLLKDGQDLNVADDGAKLVFKYGVNGTKTLETNYELNVFTIPEQIETTWASAKEVEEFYVAGTSSSDAKDEFGTNTSNTDAENEMYGLDDGEGVYLVVANGNTLLSTKAIDDLSQFVSAQVAKESVKTVKGIKVTGKYVQDVYGQFEDLKIIDEANKVDDSEYYAWEIDGDVKYPAEGREAGYMLTLKSLKGGLLSDKYLDEKAQIRDNEWPLISAKSENVEWTLSPEGKLFFVYVDKSKVEKDPVTGKEYTPESAKTNIYVAAADGYAYLTSDEKAAATIKLYRIFDVIVDDIEIAQNPNKMTYVEGEDFDTAGMKVNLICDDEVVLTVSAEDFDAFEISVYPDDGQDLTVKYDNDQPIYVEFGVVKAEGDVNEVSYLYDYSDKPLTVTAKSVDKTTGTLVEKGKLTDGTYAIVWVDEADATNDKILSKAKYNATVLSNGIYTDDRACAVYRDHFGASNYELSNVETFDADIFNKGIAADLTNAQWIIKYVASEKAYTIQEAASGLYLSRINLTYKDVWAFDDITTDTEDNTEELDEFIAEIKNVELTKDATAASYWLINGSFDASIQSAAEEEDNFYLLCGEDAFHGNGAIFAADMSMLQDAMVDNFYFFKLADFGAKSIEVLEQPVLSYNSGDKLDLHKLVVKITYTDGSSVKVPYDEFVSYGLTVADADKALAASDNGKSVVITLGDLSASTAALKVADSKADVKVNRLGGADRYETAKIIAENYVTMLGAEYKNAAVLVNSEQFPDALAGSTLAAALKAPIVITKADSLNAKTQAFLSENKVNTVYVLGGVNAIGADVESALKAMNINVIRVAGADRVATSVEIAKQLAAVKGYQDTVIITTGYNFADALSVSSAAAKNGTPILYVDGQGALAASVKEFIAAAGAKKAVILGGEAAVSANVANELKTLGLSVDRAAGANRFETSVAIAKKFAGAYNEGVVALATATTFPDALAGGVYASLIGAPVVLVDNACANADAALYISGLDLTNVVVFGGPEAVTDATVAAALLK